MRKPERTRLPTLDGKNLTVTTNWNPETPDFIKFNLDGVETIVPLSAFMRFAFVNVDEDEQMRMLPVKQMKRRVWRKTVTFTATKPFKVGDPIVVPVDFAVDMPDDARVVNPHSSQEIINK